MDNATGGLAMLILIPSYSHFRRAGDRRRGRQKSFRRATQWTVEALDATPSCSRDCLLYRFMTELVARLI